MLFARRLLPAVLILALAAGCVNARGSRSRTSSAALSPDATPSSTPSVTPSATYKISNVTIAASGSGGGSGTPTTTVFFNTTTSSGPVSDSCRVGTSGGATAKPCVCEFTWQEVNPSTGSAVTVPRKVRTTVSNVQSYAVTCAAPEVYSKEILNGTSVRITLKPGTGNTDLFSVNLYTYIKSTTTVVGSFQDAQGRYFDNILHYSCYEQIKRGMSIRSKLKNDGGDHPDGAYTLKYPSGTEFCLRKAASSGAPGEGCEGLPSADNTAQSNYYDLYIRDSERGDINHTNDRFVCPRVKEALKSLGTVGSQGQFYPLDSTFSLSLGPTVDFGIGVEAFTRVSKAGLDPTAQDTPCYGSANGAAGGGGGGASQPNSLVRSCLGFAAKPNSDGTCPYIKDQFNQIRFTYRLRRYIAIYPPMYDTDGNIIQGARLPVNTAYVLDRPLSNASSDPFKPYTMYGPKPCPFAYFDHKGVTAANFGTLPLTYSNTDSLYVTPFASGWNGRNYDDIRLPSWDGQAGSSLSCSATFAVLDSTKSHIGLRTLRPTPGTAENMWIRPIHPWAPHYEEDTNFKACAPQAYPEVRDPPLHIARDPVSGNVSWCSENYPSQNSNVAALESLVQTLYNLPPAAGGRIRPYTSHGVKGSSSIACTPTSVLPLSGVTSTRASHTAGVTTDPDLEPINSTVGTPLTDATTCDRTVVPEDGQWSRFPLLATPAETERIIRRDSSYTCAVSWDNKGSKSANRITPVGGCCGSSVRVWTGTTASPPTAPNTALQAHLEPDAKCLVPQY